MIIISSQVHYVSHGTPVRSDGTQAYSPACRAATVTEIADPNFGEGETLLGLCVINPTGIFFRTLAEGGCDHSIVGTPGSWHSLAECEQVRHYQNGRTGA